MFKNHILYTEVQNVWFVCDPYNNNAIKVYTEWIKDKKLVLTLKIQLHVPYVSCEALNVAIKPALSEKMQHVKIFQDTV